MTIAERLTRLAGRYRVKIICDLGGPYTERDERDIRVIEKWFTDQARQQKGEK